MTSRSCSLVLAILSVAVLASCGSDLSDVECTSNQQCAASLVCIAGDCVRPDEGSDAATGGDTGSDSGADTAVDTGVDTPDDVGVDTPDDIATDAPDDIAIDTPGDIAIDTPDDIATDTPGDIAIDTPGDIATDTPGDIATDTPGDVDAGPFCGNGVIDEGETCDPAIAPAPGSPACRADCSFCGDGAVDPGEACDPAAADADLCALDCSYDWGGFACAACPEGDCSGGATCTPRASMPAMCLPTCLHAASRDCPAGWTCNLTEGVCIPSDSACREICAPTESCANGVDDDCDGDVDCDDADCVTRPVCVATETNCDDRVDNDGDGATDCADDDCFTVPSCTTFEVSCIDRIDNDGDGLTDCADPDCDGVPSCGRPEICDDGIDNDGDGSIDCGDADCVDDTVCATGCPGDDIGRTEGQEAYVWSGGSADLEPVSAPCLTNGEGISFRWVAPAAGRWRIGARDDGGLLSLLGGATIIVRRTSCTGTVAMCASGSSSETTYFNAAAGAAYVVFVAVPETPIPLPFDITLFVDIAREFEQGSACTDGLDNDLDGAIDCGDPDCETAAACAPAGACQSDEDQAIFVTLGSSTVISTANECAAGCLSAGDLPGCIGECVSDNTGLTVACGACYGSVFQCLVDNCLDVCATDPSGTSCEMCQEEYCVPELNACTGPLP